MRLKIVLTAILLTVLNCAQSFAQIRFVPIAARSFSASIGGGPAMLFGDFRKTNVTPVGRVNLDYNHTTYFSIGLEGQVGRLTTNTLSMVRLNDYDISVTNNFYAANLNFKLSWGKIFKANPASFINGLYFGSGIGYASYKIKTNKAVSTVNDTLKNLRGIEWQGKTFTLPVNVGLDIDLTSMSNVRNVGVNINYQHNFIFNDRFDGYNPDIRFNLHKDSYGYLSVAIKYYFGRLK